MGYYGYYGFDNYYLILVLPCLLLSVWAQIKIKASFSRYSNVYSSRGVSAQQAARYILDANGLSHIPIERVGGQLTDYYDPRSESVHLSDSVYGSTSIAAIGVAAHEVGHAIQHSQQYTPLIMRNTVAPVVNFGSRLSFPLIIIGLLLNFQAVAMVGVALFSMVTLFQLLTLPVELNASRRALATLNSRGILVGEELRGARKVLSAAALTYVAALLVSLAQLLRFLLLVRGRGGRSRR